MILTRSVSGPCPALFWKTCLFGLSNHGEHTVNGKRDLFQTGIIDRHRRSSAIIIIGWTMEC